MSEEENKPSENTDKIQTEKPWLFKKGQSGNPNGKPKGSLSITAEIKKKLLECPKGEEKTFLEYLVEKILKKAIKDGDSRTIKQIWNYIDGMPKQEIEGKFEGLGVDVASLVKLVKDINNDGSRDSNKEPPVL